MSLLFPLFVLSGFFDSHAPQEVGRQNDGSEPNRVVARPAQRSVVAAPLVDELLKHGALLLALAELHGVGDASVGEPMALLPLEGVANVNALEVVHCDRSNAKEPSARGV